MVNYDDTMRTDAREWVELWLFDQLEIFIKQLVGVGFFLGACVDKIHVQSKWLSVNINSLFALVDARDGIQTWENITWTSHIYELKLGVEVFFCAAFVYTSVSICAI